MRHRVDTFKIGRTSAHRTSMMANMVSSLFLHGQITTTLAKARGARKMAEKMITMGKKGDLHRRRLAVSRMRDKTAVKILFDEVAPKYADRNGGYTRIIKLGKRIGDASEMCILQLVTEQVEAKKPKKTKAPKVASAPKAEVKPEEAQVEAPATEEPKSE